MNYTECDPFVYPSILEAIEEVNENGVVIKNNKEEMLAVKLKLFDTITEVITSEFNHNLYRFKTIACLPCLLDLKLF